MPWYELRYAMAARDFATAAMFIQIHPNLTAALNGIGETVLHFLAVENDAAGVARLHNQGADINCQNDFGIPAWFDVAQLGYRNLLLWFVQAGIDLNATNREGQGILSFLSSMGEDDMLEFIVNNIPHKNGRCNGDAREKLVAVINALANPAGSTKSS